MVKIAESKVIILFIQVNSKFFFLPLFDSVGNDIKPNQIIIYHLELQGTLALFTKTKQTQT